MKKTDNPPSHSNVPETLFRLRIRLKGYLSEFRRVVIGGRIVPMTPIMTTTNEPKSLKNKPLQNDTIKNPNPRKSTSKPIRLRPGPHYISVNKQQRIKSS
jgi:hypothetical protein